MSWLKDLFTGGVKDVVKEIGDVFDEFHTSDDEKSAAKLKIEKILQQDRNQLEMTARKELESKERIIVAEMQQSDNYTKRARPTVVYFGLVVIFINCVLTPLVTLVTSGEAVILTLPFEFWTAWGGIVATWSVGRSYEKGGGSNKISKTITGNSGEKKSLFE